MSGSEITSYNNLRIGGLASGLDTDSIVENLMKAEKLKVFRIEQEKTYAEWKMEAYREVTNLLTEFSSEQFNLVDSEKNILSTSGFKEAVCDAEQGAAVIMANGDAFNGDYTLNEIVRLAKAATVESASEVAGDITGTTDLSAGVISLSGKSLNIRLDDYQKTITFNTDYASLAELETSLQTVLDDSFGAGRITVSNVDGKFINLESNNSTLQVIEDLNGTDALETLGIKSGAMNIVNTGGTLEEVFGETGDVSFSINGTDFTFTKEDSVDSIMKEINYSDAGVRMVYNSLSDTFTLTATQTGAGSSIEITNTSGNVFGASSYLNITDSEVKNGQDALFYLNNDAKDNPIYRSSNVFTIDGVTYSLKETSTEEINFTVKDNVDAAFDKVKSFIDKYNSVLDTINNKINEKRDYSYAPLSDEQKESMTDDEIEKWESAGKKGVLKSDSIVYNILIDMRNAFVEKIEGSELSFFNIGVSTTSFTDAGMITIDEDKLKAVMEENLDQVMDMFTRTSEIKYSRDLDAEDARTRYGEIGFARRINDVIKKNITAVRNDAGLKGLLLEKAGIEGDTTEFTSSLYKDIEAIEDRIDKATLSMNETEDRYWDEFTTLETTIQRLNEQSNWLMSQL